LAIQTVVKIDMDDDVVAGNVVVSGMAGAPTALRPSLLQTNCGFTNPSFAHVVKWRAVLAGITLVGNDQAGKGEYFSSG
jgi:hypothetical protein